jgi:outer membrane protein TolC
VLSLLSAKKAVVETEVQLAEAKAELSQAMVELEWAVGGSIRTSAITVLEQ